MQGFSFQGLITKFRIKRDFDFILMFKIYLIVNIYFVVIKRNHTLT